MRHFLECDTYGFKKLIVKKGIVVDLPSALKVLNR